MKDLNMQQAICAADVMKEEEALPWQEIERRIRLRLRKLKLELDRVAEEADKTALVFNQLGKSINQTESEDGNGNR